MTAQGIVRKLLGNLPPKGRGVYARGQSVEWLAQWDFVAINLDRGDAYDKARALVAARKAVWFYKTPAAWMPHTDLAGQIATHEQAVADTGAVGYIVDAENGWPSSDAARADELAGLIRESIDRGFRVGFTSYPEFRWRSNLAASGAWATPQLYRPSDVRWFAEWKSLFGTLMIVPAISMWPTPQGYTFTPENYPAYLDSMPHAVGSIGWTTGDGNQWMIDDVKAWSPWGNAAMLAVFGAERVASLPATWAALILVLVLVLLYSSRK